ncbi:DUF4136 domain-containing protein [Siphonobacter sp.]|uniref:DUF4136 domain-containing protein n=1 Tax=Siphonobacter sp. TaxID=1869184 RepID=UPI003B3A6360
MKRISKSLLLLVLSAGIWTACERDPVKDLDPNDSKVFITNHSNVDYKAYKTFSIPDSVLIVENDRSGRGAAVQDLVYIDRIAKNLIANGYTRVARTAKPDLEVTPARISYTQSGYVPTYNPWYDPYWGYGGYGGFGGIGYGYGYPMFYNYYSYNENYWYVRIADLKNISADNKANVIWDAQIRGEGIYQESQITSLVDAIFAQSSYLKAN